MSRILTNKWFKLGCVLFVYLLWTLWIGSWWLLLGVPVLFDIYITKKVHWAFWKKKGVEKQTKTVEWIDALIFAIIAATLIRMFFLRGVHDPDFLYGEVHAGRGLSFREQGSLRTEIT